MKTKIVNFFKTDRSHATGAALVIELSNRLALKKQVNIHPQSEHLTGVIFQELRELAGLSQDQLDDLLSVPVCKPTVQISEPDPQIPIEPKASAESKSLKTSKAPEIKKASRKK